MPHIFSRILVFVIFVLFFSTAIHAQDYTSPTLPSNFKEANCIFKSEKFEMSIAEKYISEEAEVSTYFPAMVGDLNGDGFGEIVIPGGAHNAEQYIYIFNHEAKLIRKITLPDGATMNTNDDSVVLGDLDNDGKGEIIVTASNSKKLFVFNYNGDLITSISYPTVFPKTPGIADFNNDGIPELYVGTSIYSFQNQQLVLIADGGNYQEPTVAQDVLQSDGKRIPELVSVDGVYKVSINSLTNSSLNSVKKVVSCNAISSTSIPLRERTFALADIDLDGVIDVVTVVPARSTERKLEVKVWNTQTGAVKYDLDIKLSQTASTSIRNSWPFIGDTDANGYPDIIFMGGLAAQGHTAVYRLEYDKASHSLKERARNSTYKDYSSMSTSMSMFDFNNDGKQEVVYRDEIALYILNGETLEYDKRIDNCFSGTGWEYPVVASLTPSGESSIIMSSSHTSSWPGSSVGTLRIYGADTKNGNKPWMPARRVWNQYSFYQNMMQDDLTVISNPAALNEVITSGDKTKTMQPFNGHMLQLGIIDPRNLESVYPLADVSVDIANATYGFNRVGNQLQINFDVYNTGDAPMDPDIPIEVFKVVDGKYEVIYTNKLTDTFYPGDEVSVSISIDDFAEHYPFDNLVVHVAKDKYDCDMSNNHFDISPEEISGVLFVKKGSTGKGLTWKDAMGELSEALTKAEAFNKRYPYSLTQIWVAEGTYQGQFVMQNGVNIYGGFHGVETSIEESRPLTHPTILDAQGLGRPLTQTSDFAQPTEWRGLTLRNGKTDENGGGALLQKGSTLSYSVVKNNEAAQGGGIYATNSQIINCIIEQNTSKRDGAGVYAIDNSFIINNTIIKNKGEGKGAGVYADASIVVNNIIYKNTANSKADNIFAQGGSVKNNLANNDDSVDPLFVNFESGNYNLLPISTMMNIGDNKAIGDRKLDIAGNERIFDDKIIDLGAFEYQGIKMTLSKEGYFYVNNAKDGDGSDWKNATKELSDALVAAKLINDSKPNSVRRIWVAAGTYKGTFEMVEGADVHGGFVGHETDFNQIDTVANKTYIDAQGEGRVLTQTRNFETPTEWAGLILQNGNETATDKDVYGGGAYLKKNGIIRYSTVRNSKATAISINNKVNAYGGGVYMEEGASLLNSIIDNNEAAVMVDSPTAIEYGVAQGGGVNNVKNRLTYLIVRNNKTTSQGNTDGGAIYSTGDVVNNIINNNKGQSTIFLSESRAIINSTIVDNIAEYTITGLKESKVQNSIVYNNRTTAGDFNQVEYKTFNNLFGTDPEFEEGSYKLKTTSPARAIGNASYFPSDLSVDMDGGLRYITLKDDVRVIDAGVYQTNIKVISATATKIEVPFGTKFEDIGLLNQIEGLLEAEYLFDSNVTWTIGDYDRLMAGDYTLYGDLSNLPDGVVNPDEVQGTVTVTVRKNHISDLEELTINGKDWLPNLDLQYIIDCDNEENTLPITMRLPYFATVTFEPEVKFAQEGNDIFAELSIPRAGNYSLTVVVTSQDGENTTTYPLSIVKKFPFWSIIEQRWNNTFVINNNKEANGGYEFVSYKWYKNDMEIGTMQYYSAGDKRTDLLDENSLYYAEMIDKDGIKYTTCKANPVLMNSGIKVYPNPVRMGEAITIETPKENNKGATVSIYSLSGLSVKQVELSGDQTTVQAPSLPGMYILKVSINGGVSESIRMIVY